MNDWLRPTAFIDSDAPQVMAFARKAVGRETDPRRRAVALYYAGCRTAGSHFDAREVRMAIAVAEGRLTRLRFDGSTLAASHPTDPDAP